MSLTHTEVGCPEMWGLELLTQTQVDRTPKSHLQPGLPGRKTLPQAQHLSHCTGGTVDNPLGR